MNADQHAGPQLGYLPTKARVWRTRTRRGHLSSELTTWNYLVPLTHATVIGYATSWREAIRQVCDRLRRDHAETQVRP